MPRLLVIGFGYSTAAVVAGLGPDWSWAGTVRRAEKRAALASRGGTALLFDGVTPNPEVAAALATATHLLVAAPPDADGDPLLAHHERELRQAPHLAWIGYLSTVGVYGDHGGAWVDEAAEVAPAHPRAIQRVAAETAWRNIARQCGIALQLFRLGGIYGPGRNALVALARGTQRRIVKPGQMFSRIHVADIGGLVCAGMRRPEAGPVLHGVDDEPTAADEVVVHAASLMGLAPPPPIPVEDAGLTPIGRSFYAENRRVSNARTKSALGYAFRYPTYREGLAALAAARDWEREPPPDA